MGQICCSLIVPTANRARSLALTLDSLSSQTTPQRDCEIVVVHNGSAHEADQLQDVIIAGDSQDVVRHICDPIPGLLTGRHRGALEAKGDILIFVDDDIDAAPGWLQAIVDTFADETVQLVGGRNLPRYETEPPAWIEGFRGTTPHGGWALGYLSLLDLGDRMLDIDANYIWGLNFAIRRQALFDLGGFHPDSIPDHLQHFQGDGESGLTMKAKNRGYRAVYQPKALVYHRIPASRLTSEYFERRAFYQGVCDSYTHIRRQGRVEPLPWASSPAGSPKRRMAQFLHKLPHYARYPWHHGKDFAARHLAAPAPETVLDETTAIKQRVQQAYQAGYTFQHDAVARDADLLEWVLRENYWDYELPDLSRPMRRDFSEIEIEPMCTGGARCDRSSSI